MDPERWQRLSALFAAARERPEAERADFLARACDDDASLRGEVEALLALQALPGPLDRPPEAPTVTALDEPSAALVPGERLGPYEVLGLLGAGGMGEVYRARDTRLGRSVAIKRIRDPGARPDLRRRFEQEARAAGQLNHPNILAIYDVGTHAGLPYLVSELLEGETLRQRLAAKPMPWRRVVEIAGEVCRGLAAAHAHGIVHRDLKPDNVFLTRDGRVKLLDFGLAKLQPAAEGATRTESGLVMGTVGYMSPEQIRGEPVDARSDLFAVGAILYEMLSGAAPFRQSTAVETLAAILNEEPPDLAERRPELPPALVRIVRHCLEKRPDERFQSAGDLGFQLAGLAAPSESLVTAAPALAGRRWRTPLLAALAALLVVGAGSWLLGRRFAVPPIPTYRQLTYGHGTVYSARFARDGATVIYTAEWDGGPAQTFAMRLDTLHPQPIPLPPSRLLTVGRGEMMVLLPPGSGLGEGPAYVGTDTAGTLARAPLEGGEPRQILEGVIDADWTPDGDRLAVVRRLSGGTRLEFPPGRVLHRSAGGIGSVRIAPGGNRVAFIEYRVVDDTRGAVKVAGPSGVRTLSEGWSDLGGLAWSPSGREVWFTAAGAGFFRTLHAVGWGGRVRLVARTTGGMELQDVFPDGRVLFVHTHPRHEARGVAPGETQERDLSWFDWTHVNDLSPDGRQVLFTEEGAEAGPQLAAYLRSTSGFSFVRLGDGHATALSPDGRWAIAHLRATPPTQLVLLPTGPGAARPLPRGPIAELHWAWWFPDGKRLLVMGNERGRPVRLFVQDAAGGAPRPLAPEGITATGQDPIAPDGRRIVVDSPQVGSVLDLLLLPQGTLAPIPGSRTGDEPIRWSADGRWLYLKARGDTATAPIDRLEVATGKREPLRTIRPADVAGVQLIGDVLLTADASTYVYTYHRRLTDLYLAEGLR
jgi:Tol biopolymer transport system component